jgi:monoterpene epsilon-lactone hydrolase
MQPTTEHRIAKNTVVTHQLDPGDAQVAAAMHEAVAGAKGKGFSRGAESRATFDALMASVPPCEDVEVETDVVGTIPGVWVVPSHTRPGIAIVHLHGGWFNFGSASAFVNLIGHTASRVGARAFIPDYLLAPEHPFPAAVDDVLVCYRGLRDRRLGRIAVTCESAGGNRAVVLAARLVNESGSADLGPVGVAVRSPITELRLSGESYRSRAVADPLGPSDASGATE